ncbi:uncharacterized protein EI97DRAFT_379326 [Westerdykella ornata]|uniref:Uncharacterized protein n=1 Tax=Westerdykella ornata TaxID=318751 RepID=A0A6A6JHT3_WESOR|nr:uncharacterized protein EI97DRAFT_379326 [Westerdykella ornata]KAF2275518.1 hypothetical protein EI97DRAFT_379326 [Westerdykella ornata]
MPRCRGVDIELRSQFDIGQYAEYYPREQSYYDEAGIEGIAPPFYDPKTATVSVYVEAYQGSQFWICYSVLNPIPNNQFFLFKLYINTIPVVSWSCGQKEAWKGKTIFALFQREEKEEGEESRKIVEKRALHFTTPGQDDGRWKDLANVLDPNTCMEIRVFRAHGRTRIPREFQDYATTSYGRNQSGISLANAGRAGAGLPKRFYKFALVDPVDTPFVAFRYYYRTLEQLKHLGIFDHEVDDPTPSEGSSSGQDRRAKAPEQSHGLEDVFLSPPYNQNKQPARIRQDTGSTRAFELRRASEDDPHDDFVSRGHVCSGSAQPYRLSLPASLNFATLKQARPLPPVPNKKEPRPYYAVDRRLTRTPSPVQKTRDGISTPPPGQKRECTAAAFMGVVASAWKRRGMPTSESVSQMERQS